MPQDTHWAENKPIEAERKVTFGESIQNKAYETHGINYRYLNLWHLRPTFETYFPSFGEEYRTQEVVSQFLEVFSFLFSNQITNDSFVGLLKLINSLT